MNLLWLIFIIPVGLTLLLFMVYFFNLDMKLVSKIYTFLNKVQDKKGKDTAL